jgi:hypothetical protein
MFVPETQISLRNIADQDVLKHVWKKKVRPVLRSMKLKDLNLAPDPLHYAGYEWGLQTLVESLANDILSGRYSPERGEIVRMAKGKGLTRPLCFLATRDALVYGVITHLCGAQLLANAQPWVGFQQIDKGQLKLPDDVSDSFDWFRFWLAREGHIVDMLDEDDVKYIVESDISNFYPSIRLEAVSEHLHSQTNLEKEVVRLCIQIIDGVMPRRDYSEVSLLGLPQEQIGSSRDIAHSLLLHVDKEFNREGEQGRYSRYMDDMVVGVPSVEAGERCISRWQFSLETLGLYPNGAKTTVTPKAQYLRDAMVETNAEIERVTNELENSTAGRPARAIPPPFLLDAIASLSEVHRKLSDRPKRWGRVVRRIYTLQRAAGSPLWWEYWRQDIDDDPGAAPAILEFVRSWPLTKETVDELESLSSQYADLYPNIALLAAEVVVSAPVPNDSELWNDIYRVCHGQLKKLLRRPAITMEHERIAAAWLISVWKFGNAAQRRTLLNLVPASYNAISPVRVQALPLLVALRQSLSEWVAAKPGMAWEDALAAEYLRSLQEGEDRAVGVALSLLEPAPRLLPQRFVVLPRSFPLLEIVGHAQPQKLSIAVPGFLKKLESNPDRLRDHRVEHDMAQWRE